MLANTGDTCPPCGVPLSLCVNTPSSITPAFRKRFMIRRNTRSLILCSRNRISQSWLTLSMNPLMSDSTTHWVLYLAVISPSLAKAWCAFQFGRKPYEQSRNSGSHIACNILDICCCTIRSSKLGMPNGLTLPLTFGMYTRRDGFGR